MRLIDARDVKKRADCYPKEARSIVANILSHTKTIKDAVKVVRCKDCVMIQHCRFAQGLGLDGFCSQGERREEDE